MTETEFERQLTFGLLARNYEFGETSYLDSEHRMPKARGGFLSWVKSIFTEEREDNLVLPVIEKKRTARKEGSPIQICYKLLIFGILDELKRKNPEKLEEIIDEAFLKGRGHNIERALLNGGCLEKVEIFSFSNPKEGPFPENLRAYKLITILPQVEYIISGPDSKKFPYNRNEIVSGILSGVETAEKNYAEQIRSS